MELPHESPPGCTNQLFNLRQAKLSEYWILLPHVGCKRQAFPQPVRDPVSAAVNLFHTALFGA